MKINLPAIIGAMPGAALAATGLFENIPAYKKVVSQISDNPVSAKDVAKKYAPDLYVATSKEDLDGLKFNFFKKRLVENLYSKAFKGRNAYYMLGKNPMIMSPDKVNKYVLGHEIGHHLDLSDSGGKRRLIDHFVSSPMEVRAWKRSPFKEEKGSQKLMVDALKSYSGSDKFSWGTISAMVGALAAPLIIKAIKK
jgi:hypothetical protein